MGELDRKKLVKTKTDRPYKFSFILSIGIIIFAIILGGILNPKAVFTTLSMMPYIAPGVVFVALGLLFFYSRRIFSRQQKRSTYCVINTYLRRTFNVMDCGKREIKKPNNNALRNYLLPGSLVCRFTNRLICTMILIIRKSHSLYPLLIGIQSFKN